MELDPPLAAFTDLDEEPGTLDVNKCDELDAPWIAQKREKDAEEREARAMMAKKSAEASVLKAEAAKKRQKDLKAKADAKRKKAQMLTAVAEKAARRRENDRRRKSFQDAAAAHEYRGPSSSFGEMGENNNASEDEDAAYTLLAALKGGDSARDAAFYSNNNGKGKSKPKSRRRPAETIDSGGDRYTKPRAAPRRRCLECSTCLNPRLKKRCLGREEGFIEDDDSPVKPAEYFNQGPTRGGGGSDGPGYSPVAENDTPANVDEDSPEKLLEEVERDLNTVVFPQEMTVSPQEMTAINAERIANLTRLRDTYYPEPTTRPPADAGAADLPLGASILSRCSTCAGGAPAGAPGLPDCAVGGADAAAGRAGSAGARGQYLHRQQGRRQHVPGRVGAVRPDPGQPDRQPLFGLAL